LRLFFKILLLLFLSDAAQAQSYDSLWRRQTTERSLYRRLKNDEKNLAWQLKQAEKDKLYLSWSPLGLLFDIVDTNLTLGAEYCLTPSISIRADMGYVFQSSYFTSYAKARGVVLRPMIRIYSSRDVRSSFDVAFHYKYVKTTLEDWLGRMPVNGVPSYSEFTEFDIVRSRWGVMVFYNYRTLPFARDRCYVEFYWGAGVKYRHNISLKNQPNTTYYRTNIPEDRVRPFPTLQMGLRLVYKFPHDLFHKSKLDKTNYGKRSEGGN